ncbi:hypothetical protein DRO58_00900 [Candidatus Bathyarchaeota archaeon]|nr:MAG: hypothetical protein DRO58_00900 [Candidatus Bathyarchaeota archaeon]
MGVKDHAIPWEDLYDPSLDEALAPSLYEVYFKEGPQIYVEPKEFFKRTYLSTSMRNILNSITNVLEGKGGRNLYPLFSLYGGGKTHTLITIYHAIKSPEALILKDKNLAERLMKLKDKVRLAILDCDSDRLVPNPARPIDLGIRKIRTIWGALAEQLGRYDILRSEDQTLIPPTPETLRKLLEASPTVILIDEVAKYSARLQQSSERQLQNYGRAVMTFIENLSKAITGTGSNSILLITLPIEIKEEYGRQRLLFEPGMEEILRAIFRRIERVTSTYDRPLTVEDVVKVLKSRMFKNVNQSVGISIGNRYLGTYSSEREIFREKGIREGGKISDHYPFHPAYINTLYDLVTRIRELEKTRDAIKLTRKVIRKLWESGENPSLIMPWHIDPTVDEIGNLLITRSLKEFQVVLERDFKERLKGASKPRLAKAIATSIFLKTYIYGVTVKAERVFPTKEDVAFHVYEEVLMQNENSRTVDIPDVLDELYKSTLLYLQEQDGRYWFSPLLNVIELVEEEARRVNDAEALSEVKEYTTELLTKPLEQVLRATRRRVRREAPQILDPRFSQVLESFEHPAVDEASYTLITYLKPLTGEEILEAIYNVSTGKPRAYKNTICLLHPESGDAVRMLMEQAKHLIACDRVSHELDRFFDEEMKTVANRKLNEYKSGVLDRLLRNILTRLNQVEYPIFDPRTNREYYGSSRTKTAALSLIRLVEETLAERDVGKIARELTFDRLNYMLKERLGIDLSGGERTIPVSELLSYFYTNPRLPFTKPETVKEALEDGITKLMMGIQRGEDIFYKRIYRDGEEIPLTETGKPPTTIEDTDIILPWRIALDKLLENIREERVTADLTGKRRIWHVVRVEGEDIKIAELMEREGYHDIIKPSPIIRKEITILEDFDVILSRETITERPGTPIEIKVEVKPIGEFRGEVKLSTTRGEINPRSGRPPFESRWTLTTPKEVGEYTYRLTATVEGAKPKVVDRTLSLRVRPEEAHLWTESLHDYVGYELEEVEVEDYNSLMRVITVLDEAWVSRGEASVRYGESTIKLSFKDVEPTVVAQLVKDSSEYLGSMYIQPEELSIQLKLRKPVKIGRREITQLEGLEKTRYKVRKG